MHVDEPVRVVPHERRAEHAHEPRDDDEVGAFGVDGPHESRVERVARAEVAVINDGRVAG